MIGSARLVTRAPMPFVRQGRARGLSMIECVFAMYLFALCVGIIMDLFPSVGARTARRTTLQARATLLAQSKMEELLLFGAHGKKLVRGTFRGDDSVFAYAGTLEPWYRDENMQVVTVTVHPTGHPTETYIRLASLRVPTSTQLFENLDTTDDDGAILTPQGDVTAPPGTDPDAPPAPTYTSPTLSPDASASPTAAPESSPSPSPSADITPGFSLPDSSSSAPGSTPP